MGNIAMIVGPLLGGILVGPVGVAGVFASAVGLFALAMFAVARVPTLPPHETGPQPHLLRSLGEGIGYVMGEPQLRWIVWLAVVLGLFGRSAAYVFPAFTHDVLHAGATELSWLLAARGAGAFAGSLAAASVGGLRRRGMAMMVCASVFGVLVLAFSIQRSLGPALALAALMGAAQFLYSGFTLTLLQTSAPDRLRGRVLSFYMTTVTGVTSLGVLVLGSAGTLVGIDVAIAVGAALLLAASVDASLRATPLRRSAATAAEVGVAVTPK